MVSPPLPGNEKIIQARVFATMSGTSVSAYEVDTVPELNANLDHAVLANTFARTGRLQIANLLTDASARRVHQALEQETPWGLTLNDGKKVLEFQTVSPKDYQEMAIAAWDRAHSGFQYFHHHYRLFQNAKIYPAAAEGYHAKLVAFLTSAIFFAFIREVTGQDSISSISSTATLYQPLDFLTIHDDGVESGKFIAYVLNMTPKWQPDWGGALQFFDADNHLEESYLPAFNALNLFRVPTRHSVSQVAAFGGFRYSVSGWFGLEQPDPLSGTRPRS